MIVGEYLPDPREVAKLPKQWLCNVIYTTVKDDFAGWVKGRIEARNAGIVKSKNLGINMDPAIMKAFLNSSDSDFRMSISYL